MPVKRSNVSGQAYALMVITPIVPGEEAALRDYIEGFSQDDSPLARLAGTHFARWVIVPDFVHDPEQPSEDRLGCEYLVFTSNFDGPLDAYLDALGEELATEARAIWGRCAGCPQEASADELKAYLLHNQVDTGFFVAAYPQATVAKVRDALAVRERLIDFAQRAQAMAPAELKRAFDEELRR
jgi:hypothetical protein